MYNVSEDYKRQINETRLHKISGKIYPNDFSGYSLRRNDKVKSY